MDNKPTNLDAGFARSQCHLGEKANCCSYLGMGEGGWKCLKGSNFAIMIWERRQAGTMKAMGDHCAGPPDFKVLTTG